MVIIPLVLNKSYTLRFILDTGVDSIITDPSFVTMSKVRPTGKVTLNGIGIEDPIVASVTIGNTIQIGDMRANFQNIVLFDEAILRLSAFH